jgi:hypothetical protein
VVTTFINEELKLLKGTPVDMVAERFTVKGRFLFIQSDKA